MSWGRPGSRPRPPASQSARPNSSQLLSRGKSADDQGSHFSEGDESGQLEEQQRFDSLLEEVLTVLQAEKAELHASPEALEANDKLIKVIVTAGLDVLHTAESSVEREGLGPQACKSLRAIAVIISKSPQLLYARSSPIRGSQRSFLNQSQEDLRPITSFLVIKLVSVAALTSDSAVLDECALSLDTLYDALHHQLADANSVSLDHITHVLSGTASQ